MAPSRRWCVAHRPFSSHSAHTCAAVAPVTSIRFIRLRAPPMILTAPSGRFNRIAKNLISGLIGAVIHRRRRHANAQRALPFAVDAFTRRARPQAHFKNHTAAGFRRANHAVARSPKIAVPTRTSVAPSSMATSKSCDMPMERVGSATPHFFASSSRKAASRRKHRRACDESSE